MNYRTLRVSSDGPVCTVQLHRPEANNTINALMVEECRHALDAHEASTTVVVLEGSPDVFCFGADFHEIRHADGSNPANDPEALYDLWSLLASGPYVTVAHVRGKTNAGGVGFVAASDIVLADETALFSLSELLFGVMPACVLPFLIRRVGFQRANYLTLTTQPVSVQQAHAWGLVDAYEANSAALLRKHLLRLRRLSKASIVRYKRYVNTISDILAQAKNQALAANREVFSDPRNLESIRRYVEHGLLPWETSP